MKGNKTTEYVYDEEGIHVKTLETTNEPLSSIELKEDTKGAVHPTVKVYNSDPQAARDIAVKIAKTLDMEVHEV